MANVCLPSIVMPITHNSQLTRQGRPGHHSNERTMILFCFSVLLLHNSFSRPVRGSRRLELFFQCLVITMQEHPLSAGNYFSAMPVPLQLEASYSLSIFACPVERWTWLFPLWSYSGCSLCLFFDHLSLKMTIRFHLLSIVLGIKPTASLTGDNLQPCQL